MWFFESIKKSLAVALLLQKKKKSIFRQIAIIETDLSENVRAVSTHADGRIIRIVQRENIFKNIVGRCRGWFTSVLYNAP